LIIEGKDHIPIPGDGEAEQIARQVQPFLDEDVFQDKPIARSDNFAGVCETQNQRSLGGARGADTDGAATENVIG
jgi:hypothetical protein